MKTFSTESETENSSESVFARIALSLSGGGFRASAYSLGTLNALYLLGLLDKVHMLSTASGGTLTGIFYALLRKQGQCFPCIYDKAYTWLAQDAILPDAIDNWKQAVAKGGADIKLIHAFANVYDKLYNEQSFGIFWGQPELPEPPFHLQSIIFGATELHSGLTFRFQHAAFLPQDGFTVHGVKPPVSYYIGNGNVHLSQDEAQKLRLGDIAAASSCFPVGFEPMVLPDDFRTAPDQKLAVNGRNGLGVPAKIAIVDGGIYDNQGIESLLRANERNEEYCQSEEFRKNKLSNQQQSLLKPTTLFLVADVDAASTGLYDAMKPLFATDNGASLRRLVSYAVGGVLGLLVTSALLVYFMEAQGNFLAGCLLMLGSLGALLLLLGRWAWQKLTARLRALDERIYKCAVPVFLQLTLAQWKKLVTVRVQTASVLLQSVFTRRVRSQNYNLLYNRNKPAIQAPIVASIVGGLMHDYPAPCQGDPRYEIVNRVRTTVQTASQMSTTLWWGKDKYRLPDIVNCAGLTLCYRLLKRFKENPPADKFDQEVERRANLLWHVYEANAGKIVVGPAMLGALGNGVPPANNWPSPATPPPTT